MDTHELAIAALNKVAQSGMSHRDGSSTGDFATGNDIEARMKEGSALYRAASLQDLSKSPDAKGNSYQVIEGRVYQHSGEAGLPLTSSNTSQSTNIDGHETAVTPPTSDSEGFSSQSTNPDGPTSQLSQLSQLAAAAQPLTNPPRPSLTCTPTAGHKRTADGQFKSTLDSPPFFHGYGHSRNTSTFSNISTASSKIGELSSELRTRLSYAMVKVNNGWQSNSIDEVESLASQKASPTSSSSTLHQRRSMVTSPRTAIASVQAQTSNVSAAIQAPLGDFDLYPRTEPASRTYESFWRDHSTSANVTSHRQSFISPPSKSLGPPADIHPTSTPRRSGTPNSARPLTIPGQGSNSSLHNTPGPRTPNRTDFRDGPVIQTPSQKTIQEQDAIATLLFMSSPGNSATMKHTLPPPRSQASPQQSPLRTEFNLHREIQGRRVGFDEIVPSDSTASSEAGAEYRRNKIRGNVSTARERSDAIDRMLDQMDSSSDEDEVPLKYASPRRLEAGRV